MKREFRFAIAGTGLVSKIHYEQISTIGGAWVTAVFSRKEEKAREFAEQIGADWYTDYNEMLQREDIDIVNIVTPSGMHADMTIAAAKAGKHVIVEKPMDISLKKAFQMIEVCREHRVKLSVISQHRFDPSALKVKSDLQSGRFGKMVLGQCAVNWYRPQSYFDKSPWRGTWGLNGGGVLINQAIHTIDLFQHFMGEVESVYAHTAILAHEKIEVEDAAVATVKFKNGSLGTITGTTAAYPGLMARLEIFGTCGSAVIENDQLTHYYFRDEAKVNGQVVNLFDTVELISEGEPSDAGSDPGALNGVSHRMQILDVMEAIRADREPSVSGEEGLKPLKIILAIYESSRTGKPVQLDEMT